MANLLDKMDEEFLGSLKETIDESTIEVLGQVFGYDVSPARPDVSPGDAIVSCVSFWQSFDAIKLCFVFDDAFIETMVPQFYTKSEMENDEDDHLKKDVVCELANIIGNKVKVFANSHGFQFVMDLPCSERLSALEDMSDKSVLKVGYSVDQNAGLANEDVLCVSLVSG